MTPYKYSMYSRHSKRLRKRIYYAQFRDPNTGQRLSGRSTGKTDKNEAKIWCDEQLRKGTYLPKAKMKFSEYSDGWFIWGKCGYLQMMIDDDHGYTRRAAESNRSALDLYILPYFGDMRIADIKQYHILAFRLHLKREGGVNGHFLSNKYINNIMSTLSVMLGEATRLEHIPRNPCKGIKKLGKGNSKPRQCLTNTEFKALFDPSMKEFIWKDYRFYVLNLLAALTGIRQGECLGLTADKVLPEYILIDCAWKRKYGLGPTKTGITTTPVISPVLYQHLQDLINTSPYKNIPGSFLFCGKDAHTPLDHKTILEQLYSAFQKIGISEESRRERQISFHSWRRFFITASRLNKIPDVIIREAVGHSTEEMTENYTRVQLEHMIPIRQMQEDMLPEAANG